MAMLMWTLVT